MEVNQSKEEMKSLQTDLSRADHEISVSHRALVCVRVRESTCVRICVCVCPEPQEEGGVSSAVAEHAHTDERSSQSPRV